MISSIDIDKGHRYLGMIFTPTNDFSKIINIYLNDRMGNISKFYAWLDINTDTHIEIKLLVLDSCLFSSMLYAIETWGNIKFVEQRLRKIEIKALKSILNVKCGTSNDLVYNELKRPDII